MDCKESVSHCQVPTLVKLTVPTQSESDSPQPFQRMVEPFKEWTAKSLYSQVPTLVNPVPTQSESDSPQPFQRMVELFQRMDCKGSVQSGTHFGESHSPHAKIHRD
jgi:hypothetical protein